MKIETGETALVTSDNWFFAPDGREYRAVFGTIGGVKTAEEILGVKTNQKSTNWYLEIGNMILAGCQIHHVIKCKKINPGPAGNWVADPAHGIRLYDVPCRIYQADDNEEPPKLFLVGPTTQPPGDGGHS